MRALLVAVVVVVVASISTVAWCQLPGEQPYNAQVWGSPLKVAGPEAWSYTVTNTSTSLNYTVWLVSIEVDEGAEINNVYTPVGWAADWSEPHFITLISTSTDLAAGQSKSGFVAEYSSRPVYQNWSAMFNNIADPFESPTTGGSVLTNLPEPGSLAVLIVGLGFAAGLARRRAG
ncbi:MAG: hypothetical protein M1133_11210 [Armatimonadetes bacterium]|nr:hypothetical protein [Armatimonadota bacterium]